MWQTIIVALVIAAAGCYAGWRVFRTFKRTNEAGCCCDGYCEGCQLKDLKQRCGHKKPDCCEKK